MMTTQARQTFRVSFDIELSLNTIDERMIGEVRQHMLGFTEADIQEFIRRDEALLQALLSQPAMVQAFLLRRAAEASEHVEPDDESLASLQATLDDVTLIDQLKTELPADDYTYLKSVADDGVLYDNTSFFEEALTIRQTNFTIEPLGNTE